MSCCSGALFKLPIASKCTELLAALTLAYAMNHGKNWLDSIQKENVHAILIKKKKLLVTKSIF